MKRCWGDKDDLARAYHDNEWCTPVYDDRTLFEFLILEGAQAGLSWITILRKRGRYREVFADFDPQLVARFNKNTINMLLKDPGIVRNKLKIESAVSNAKAFLQLQDRFGSFDQYVWQFVGGKPIQNQWRTLRDIPASTPQSEHLSKDLKKHGFRFVGSTICYAFMQAVGMVNDHTTKCFRHLELKQ